MKQTIETRENRIRYWKEHIEKSIVFDGSEFEYCRQNQLKPSTFSGYKRSLGFIKTKKKDRSLGGFACIEVKDKDVSVPRGMAMVTSQAQGPSTKWLAGFVSEMLKLSQS